MATNDFLPFGTGTEDADQIMPQANYALDIRRQAGNPQGIASRSLNNKALRQSSTIAAAVAQAVSDLSGDNMLDDGNVAAKVTSIKEVISPSPDALADATLDGTERIALKQANVWLRTTVQAITDFVSAALRPSTFTDSGALAGTEVLTGDRTGYIGVTANRIAAFVTGIYTITVHAGVGAVARTLLAVLMDRPISLKAFGAVGDWNDTTGTNDTTSINAALTFAQSVKKSVFVPAGQYLYSGGGILHDGVVLVGEGANTSIFVSALANPTNDYLFYVFGTKSGIRDIGFKKAVAQTGGFYVSLKGQDAYLENSLLRGHFGGVRMWGSVVTTRHCRLQETAVGGTAILSEDGDNTQTIFDVVIGGEAVPNVAASGIHVRNSAALTIDKCSVLQHSINLRVTSDDAARGVASLIVANSFFDGGAAHSILMETSGTGLITRVKFNNVWANSVSGAGLTMVGNINGVDFHEFAAHVCVAGSGVSLGAGCQDINFYGAKLAGNLFGMYLSASVTGLTIIGSKFGRCDGLEQNVNGDLVFGTAGNAGAKLIGNTFASDTKVTLISNATDPIVIGNEGILFESEGSAVVAIGNTTVVVTHGLAAAPSKVLITPLDDPNTRYWVQTTSMNATTFTISISAAIGYALNFAWFAKV